MNAIAQTALTRAVKTNTIPQITIIYIAIVGQLSGEAPDGYR